ncbi:MAG: GDSL-type esterase/lipase family protein [Anaerolineales bacterium]|jgi:lysophospholipase L1-like esterase
MNIAQKIREKFLDNVNMASGMLRSWRGDPQAWEASIRRYEARERLQPVPVGAVVFTGSSSITFWVSMEQDMAPILAINRGFGGSRIGDVVHYADRIILPCCPRAVVLYAGTNDIAWPHPATPQQVFDGYQRFVQRVHAAQPEVSIYYVSICPAPSRWRYWPIVRETNRLIQAHAQTDPRLHFIDITCAFLGPDGWPDRRLFRNDRLHPNAKGYEKWTALLKPVLLKDLFPTNYEP